jgi:hypothetical protein
MLAEETAKHAEDPASGQMTRTMTRARRPPSPDPPFSTKAAPPKHRLIGPDRSIARGAGPPVRLDLIPTDEEFASGYEGAGVRAVQTRDQRRVALNC